MAKRRGGMSVGRRGFLKGATVAGAAALTPPLAAEAQPIVPRPPARVLPRPNLVAETLPPGKDPATQISGGGDFMVDVLKSLDLEYCAINPASSFRGIQEAIIH